MFRRLIRTKILLSFFIVSASLIIAIFYAFEEAGKEAFKTMEREKAYVIVETITPTIAMNLYLGFTQKVQQIIKDTISSNENILGITVFKDGKVVSSFLKEGMKEKEYFVISKEIFGPNNKEKVGKMHIAYSYEHYNQLVEKYRKLLFIFLGGITVFLLLFSFYLKQLLSPLQRIVLELKNYSIKKNFNFKGIDRNDEIGAIATVLENMQKKIQTFSTKQQEMNKLLEQKVQEKTKELRERLYRDHLTGLFNRFKLQEDLNSLRSGSLVILNIDDFKEINDLFGHKIGDKILINFAKHLKELISTNNPRIYRLSGDEFALLFGHKMTQRDIEQFLDLFSKRIEKMIFFYGDKELALHVTMGASLEKEGALEKADIALKKAKNLRKVYEIYQEDDKAVEKQYQQNIEWIKRLKRSVELDRVVPFFQPIVNVHTLQPKGYESLVRILDEDGNPLSPTEFLEIAKKSRYYSTLTKIMIKKSCIFFEKSNCSFSINLSILDIFNEGIVKTLQESIQKYKVANRIILEIVESEGVKNYDQVYEFIHKMKNIGCQIAIDDFGSGYSNFEHLLRLPVDFLKIDGSLIKNVAQDENSQLIISTIVSLAKKKGIKTVAEYVSSLEILEEVKRLGVDFAQGHLFAKPQQFVNLKCG
ncbi:MAG: EAL domain-containing protein [Epsilonproteobacteria bacterium]|nr:EAL domain-containing protein [Campylobacterota bacterium]